MNAWKIAGAFEPGGPQPVALSAQIKKRLKHLREQWFENIECEAKLDPKTGEVYLIPTGNVYDPEEEKAKHAARVASRKRRDEPRVSHDPVTKPSVRVRKCRTLLPL